MTVWRLKHTVTSTVQAAKATKVTAAHHSVWRHLYDSMHATQKPKSKLKFVTLDKENNKSTLWQREVFLRICSKEELAEKAYEIEVAIPVHKQVKRHGTTSILYRSSVIRRKSFLGQATRWGRNQWASADRLYFRIQTVDGQGLVTRSS